MTSLLPGDVGSSCRARQSEVPTWNQSADLVEGELT